MNKLSSDPLLILVFKAAKIVTLRVAKKEIVNFKKWRDSPVTRGETFAVDMFALLVFAGNVGLIVSLPLLLEPISQEWLLMEQRIEQLEKSSHGIITPERSEPTSVERILPSENNSTPGSEYNCLL